MKKILSGLLTVCLLVSMLAVADTPIKAEAASTSGSLEQRITQLQKKAELESEVPVRKFYFQF